MGETDFNQISTNLNVTSSSWQSHMVLVWELRDLIQIGYILEGFPGGAVVEKSLPMHGIAWEVRDMGLIPGSGRREGNGNPLQYSCLDNPMDRGAWQATVHGVTKSWTWLSDWLTHTHTHTHRHTHTVFRMFSFVYCKVVLMCWFC